MTTNNPFFIELRRRLVIHRNRAKDAGDKQATDAISGLIYLLDNGVENSNTVLEEAKNIGGRNPSFDGDYVGWLDDDFTD